jgi:D-sedoheptulose 7-phosphate isomerase
MSHTGDYMAETARVIQAIPEADIDGLIGAMTAAWREGRRIFLCGNGGSGSLCTHAACDFNKGCSLPGKPRMKVISLSDNLAAIMAYANDVCYEDIFVEQMVNLFEPGDLVIGVSGSGNSENVYRALAYAREHGGVTGGLFGYGGGRCRALCDHPIVADTFDMQHAEDAHLVLVHLFMKLLVRKAAAGDVG